MAYTTIKKPSDYFDGKTYLGSASAVTVTGLNFQPDLVWVKDRDNGNNHCLVDAVRGTGKYISSDLTSAETNNATNSISAFNSDGFTTGTANPANEAASTTKGFMSWNWLASNTTASNTDGSITSTVSANTTSGFSIVSYTGGGSFGDTVGHGLGAVPAMIIVKTTNATSSWYIWQKAMGATDNQFMDFSTGALQTSGATIFDVSAMSSTTFTLGTNTDVNGSGSPKIAYCFAEKQGFSKFGSYVGNGSTDGPFIYTGFKPAFAIFKNINAAEAWNLFDNKRIGHNGSSTSGNFHLNPNSSAVENVNTGNYIDFLSNGIKIRTATNSMNVAQTYIYMAFAEEPLVGDNPATAR